MILVESMCTAPHPTFRWDFSPQTTPLARWEAVSCLFCFFPIIIMSKRQEERSLTWNRGYCDYTGVAMYRWPQGSAGWRFLVIWSHGSISRTHLFTWYSSSWYLNSVSCLSRLDASHSVMEHQSNWSAKCSHHSGASPGPTVNHPGSYILNSADVTIHCPILWGSAQLLSLIKHFPFAPLLEESLYLWPFCLMRP